MRLTSLATAKTQVLVVDDDLTIRGLLSEALVARGYEVCVAPRAEDARAFFPVVHPAVVVLDWRLPDGDGLELLPEIKRAWPDTEIIMMTGYSTTLVREEALRRGAIGFLNKPFRLDDLILAVHAACQHRNQATFALPRRNGR